MELLLQREPSERDTTFGDLSIDMTPFCDTLEDQVREPRGWREGLQPVDYAAAVLKFKVPRETAIPSGRYRVTFQDSTRFGPDTLTINNVPGFTSIRIHGGNNKDDTEGCVLVGDHEDRQNMTISGAKFDHVLDRLKARVKPTLDAGQEAWITIRNHSGGPADEAQA